MTREKDSLTEKLAAWLAKHGYPFELRVGHTLRSEGWRVEHAKWFADSATLKPRELDVLATRYFRSESQQLTLAVSLAVECKSTDRPWIGFAAPRNPSPLPFAPVALSDHLSRDAIVLADKKKLDVPGVLRPQVAMSHGLIKGFTDSKSGDPTAPYAALQSVVASCVALGRANENREVANKGMFVPHLVVPIIVTDAPLFEYRLNNSGEATLSETDSLPALAPATTGLRQSFVWITGLDRMEHWLTKAERELRIFGKALLPYHGDLYALSRERYLKEHHYDPDPAP